MEGNISNISILACKDFLFNNNALVARHNTTFKVIKTFTSGNVYNFTIDGYIFLFFFYQTIYWLTLQKTIIHSW